MRSTTRYLVGAAVLATLTGAAVLGASAASADNLQQNDLSAVPATHTVETGALDATSYQITATNANADGQTGCNAADGSPAVVTIHAPAGVTVDPSTSLTFTACQAPGGHQTQTVNFSSDTPGDYPITATVADSGVGGYNLDADFTLHVTAPVVQADTTAPVITASDITIEATGPLTPVTYHATAFDAGDNAAVPVSYDISGPFAVGVHTVVATASDQHGNTTTKSFTVTVTVHTAPAVLAPANVIVEATGPSGAAVALSGGSATDLVNGNLPLSFDPASGSTFPLGTTTVDVSATDAAGNTGHASFTVTVHDTTAPVLPNPQNINLDATSAAGAVASYGPAMAHDLVCGDVPVVFTPASGSTFALGAHTVSYTATDEAGNQAAKTFDVNVTVPWSGLNQPINRDGTSSFKLGSTVPVKFNSFPGLHATLTWTKSDSTPDGSEIEAVNSNPADTGNLFRYDATAGQYIFNLGTKSLSAGDWYLHVFLGDGVDHVTKISLRK